MFPVDKLDFNWLIHRVNNRSVERHLQAMKGTVYDLGCGTRPYESDILRFASRYVGVDWSNSVHKLRADVVADLNHPLPIEAAVADNVVSFQVLEHLSEPQTMLNEAFRLLRPGGRIFLAVPFQWHIHEDPWDYFRYTRFGLEHMLKKAGFTEVSVEAQTGFWSMWILKLNYQSFRIVYHAPRPLNWITRVIFIPFWWLDQHLACALDQVWPGERETAGYFAVARKPGP